MQSASSSSFDALLARMAELDASDLFLTVGSPPLVSVAKRFVAIGEQPLGGADLERLAAPFLAGERAARFRERPELDLAHALLHSKLSRRAAERTQAGTGRAPQKTGHLAREDAALFADSPNDFRLRFRLEEAAPKDVKPRMKLI